MPATSDDGAGVAGCACEGRYVGLFDPHASSPHPDILQGLPLQGSRRRATDCAGVTSAVALMAEDARASPDVFDTTAAALCSRCDAHHYQMRIAERGCTQCALCALSRPAPMDPLSRFMHIMRGGGGGGGGGITSEGGDSDQFPHDNRSVITAAEYVSPLIGGGGAANREHILLRHH